MQGLNIEGVGAAKSLEKLSREFLDVLLEQSGEDQMDGQSDEGGRAVKSRRGRAHIGHYY